MKLDFYHLDEFKYLSKQVLISIGVIIIYLLLCELLLYSKKEYHNQVFDRDYTGGNPIEINELGVRGEIPLIQKDEDEIRILALGDSTTFGTGLATEMTWPHQLEDILINNGKNVTVINSGIPGSNIKDLDHLFLDQWIEYDPDYVILAVTGNVPSFEWISRAESPKNPYNKYTEPENPSKLKKAKTSLNRLLKRTAFFSFSNRMLRRFFYFAGVSNHTINSNAPYGSMLAHGWLQGDLNEKIVDEAWIQMESSLLALKEHLDNNNIELIVTYFPTQFMLSEDFSDNPKFVPKDRIAEVPSDITREICEDDTITFVDVKSMLKEENMKESQYINFDFIHLNESGCSIVAKRLANILL